jgi:hypothetical protein
VIKKGIFRDWSRRAVLAAILGGAASGCTSGPASGGSGGRLAKARAMFAEHCRDAGEKIFRTVDDVDGIFLINRRPENNNYDDQFAMDDPYGNDAGGDRYIESFLRGGNVAATPPAGVSPDHIGYIFVEALDPRDGVRYRYAGRIEEPWQTDKRALKGYTRFTLDRTPAVGPKPRYALEYKDISTREDREYWIAGSSLKVLDLETNTVVAERVGYMIDLRQGSREGGRRPWFFAANNSCPSFSRDVHQILSQFGQADRFAEKSLHPTKVGK